jgi:hypothetical protein
VFLACCAVVVGVFVRVARGAAVRPGIVWVGVAAWLAATGLAGGTGVLAPGPTPPPLMVFFVRPGTTMMSLRSGRSRPAAHRVSTT